MTRRYRLITKWLVLLICIFSAGAAAAFHNHWMPAVRRLAGVNARSGQVIRGHEGHDHSLSGAAEPSSGGESPSAHSHGADDPSEHNHGEEPADHAHDEATALQMSRQAEASIGVTLRTVELVPYAKTISVPATVVQRPGRSQVQITAPFTGLVTQIYRTEGEAVTPGMPLFDLQLTHEELVEAQAEFLRIGEELDVVKQEVARVSKVAAEGVVPGKTLLARQYEQQKLEAALHAQRQRLVLHRLTPEQVDNILETRALLQDLTVTAPPPAEDSNGDDKRLMQVQQLKVEQGQHVAAGAPLCLLADHGRLYIQGKAFEQDIPVLAAAASDGRTLTAVFQSPDKRRNLVEKLKILYLANEVQVQSRAFHFYVMLPNELVRDTKNGSGQRFIDWRFKAGQQLRLLVPVEPATQRMVLPVEAVILDGAEAYVYEHNTDHFDRRTVQIEHRDQDVAVFACDGSLKPGVKIAVTGAYQIHLASKNKGRPAVAEDGHAHH